MSNEPPDLIGDSQGWRVAVLSTILRTFAAFGVLPAIWSIGTSLSSHNYQQATNLLIAFTLLLWAAFSSRKTPRTSAAVSVGILIGVGFTSLMTQGLTANVSALLTAACMLALLTLGPNAAVVAAGIGAAGLLAAAFAIRWAAWMPPRDAETFGHALRSALIFVGFGGGSVAAVHYIIKRLERATADLSERTLALRRSEAEFRALFDNVFEGVFRTTREGRLLMANRAFADMLGYASPDELLHVDVADAIYARPADRAELWRRLVRDGELRHAETMFKRKDGREIPVSINARVVRDAAGELRHEGSAVDLTERKRLEGQLVQAAKMEAVGRLAGGIAHDFNNLMTIILGYSEILHESTELPPPERRHLDSIRAAAGSASALTRQLLAFSRKQILAPQIVDLNVTIEKMLLLLRRLLGEHIVVETQCDASLWAVRADPGQIEQVILNLCVNARDAMPGGGRLTIETANVELTVEAASQIDGASAGPHATLRVTDTGVGMDADAQARIFEPFYTTKDPAKGTGLGLATVYGILRQSGGSVSVRSEPGTGTAFTILLPRAVPVSAEAAVAEPAPRGGHETVLIVEDERDVREIISLFLAAEGYEVLQAENGLDALKVCERSSRLDLVVTDVVMPGMGGAELAARLATSLPLVRVVLMTGYTDNATVAASHEPGRAVLQKPFTRDSLLTAVRQALDGAT